MKGVESQALELINEIIFDENFIWFYVFRTKKNDLIVTGYGIFTDWLRLLEPSKKQNSIDKQKQLKERK